MSPLRRFRQGLGWLLGLGLTAGAVAYAVQGADWSAMTQLSPWLLLGLAALVGLNLWATAALCWAVNLLFPLRRAVSLTTMNALIALSQLVNYIPVVRIGLWGRAVYLKTRYGLRYRDSGITLIYLSVVAGAVLLTVGAALLAGHALQWRPIWGWVGAAGALVLLQVLFPLVIFRLPVERPGAAWSWSWVPLRVLDLLAAVGRIKLSFLAVGVEMNWTAATLLAIASLLVKLISITPNGLGLAEWTIAWLAGALAVAESDLGAAAAIVDRLAEIVVTLVAAAASALWLWHDARSHPRLAGEEAGLDNADSQDAKTPRRPANF